MDVGLTRKNFTLRNYLNKHQHEKECNISNCSINDKKHAFGRILYIKSLAENAKNSTSAAQ